MVQLDKETNSKESLTPRILSSEEKKSKKSGWGQQSRQSRKKKHFIKNRKEFKESEYFGNDQHNVGKYSIDEDKEKELRYRQF